MDAKAITHLIPCNTNHVAVFNDGTQYEIIGWGSRSGSTRVMDGDVMPAADISGLITRKGKVLFADECKGFSEYKVKSGRKIKIS